MPNSISQNPGINNQNEKKVDQQQLTDAFNPPSKRKVSFNSDVRYSNDAIQAQNTQSTNRGSNTSRLSILKQRNLDSMDQAIDQAKQVQETPKTTNKSELSRAENKQIHKKLYTCK